MKKLYIVGPSDGCNGSYCLCNEDGFVMASHYCSHIGFAEGDLIENRPERKEQRKEYLKDGYEIITATKADAIMLGEQNKKFADKELMEKYAIENGFQEVPKIKVEITMTE